MRCRWASPVPNGKDWWAITGCSQEYSDILLEIFGDRLASYLPPFETYVGMHVRGGDKAKEGKVFTFETFFQKVQALWNTAHNVFIATDDASVLGPQLEPLKAQGYKFTWTGNEERWSGGTPVTASTDPGLRHVHDSGAVSAVLDDILGLARAPFLIGSMNSGFFRLAYLLNERMHAGMTRQSPWCWDIFMSMPCDVRTDIMGAVGGKLDWDFKTESYTATCAAMR